MNKYILLLDRLIETPSISRTEDRTADMLVAFLQEQGIRDVRRDLNNVWTTCAHFDSKKPTLLLNSHHDTVRPCASYTRDPFKATHENGRIYGLGSNDAGASLILWTYNTSKNILNNKFKPLHYFKSFQIIDFFPIHLYILNLRSCA